MKSADKKTENDRKKNGNQNGGDRVGVKNLQKLDVGGDNRNKVALVLALKLCGAKPAQRDKDLFSYKRQKLEGDKVVAGLLGIAQTR